MRGPGAVFNENASSCKALVAIDQRKSAASSDGLTSRCEMIASRQRQLETSSSYCEDTETTGAFVPLNTVV